MAHTSVNELESRFRVILEKLPPLAGAEVVNFAMENFRQQGFGSPGSWPKRKNPTKWGTVPRNSGRNLLIDTGNLKRSIRVLRFNQDEVVIGTDVPYAKVHNEGFKGSVIQSVKSFTRKSSKGFSNVKAFTRTIQQDIPARPFLGDSPVLTDRLKKMITSEIMKAFNQ